MAIIKWKNIKEFVWRVVTSIDKTAVVVVENVKVHPLYNKRYVYKKKFHVHDNENLAGVWDLVKIRECKPVSKLKKWQLVDVVEKSRI